MNINEIARQTDEILMRLHSLATKQENICAAIHSNNEAYSDFAELGELHNKAEALRQQLKLLKNRSRLDSEVIEIEKKLDEALNQYFWLWQKCKENLPAETY